MRRYIAVLLALCMFIPSCAFAAADDDDDLLIEEVIEELIEDGAGESSDKLANDGSQVITISATGDFTIGGDSRKKTDIFDEELKRQGGDINFTMRNIRDLFMDDDLTIINFEGTLTDSKHIPDSKKNNEFLFSAPPSYVTMLTDNGVNAVALENNHIMDHGEDAYEETKRVLKDSGITYSTSTEMGVIEVKGIQIAMLSYLCIDRYDQLWEKVPADIAAAKAVYPLVIVSFHWGNEKDYSPTANQIKMGRLAVDAGADLVLGHHSHRINPIEEYKGKYICYSLGNFCFAGNSRPSDMNSFVFQTRFKVKNGEATPMGFRIVPISISSRADRNDFTPTVQTKPTTIDAIINTLKDNGKKLEYAVRDYPTEWDKSQ